MEKKIVHVRVINNILYDGKPAYKQRDAIYPVRISPSTQLPITNLSSEEETWLEEKTGTIKGYYGLKSPFWLGDTDTDAYQVRIREPLVVLNLEVPEDFIKHKILKSMTSKLTENPAEMHNQRYELFMYSPEDIAKADEAIYEVRREARKALFTMTSEEQKEALQLLGRPIVGMRDIQIEKALSEFIDDKSSAHARRFLDSINDRLRKEKLLVISLLNKGKLFKSKGQICLNSEDNSLGSTATEVAQMLSEPKNSKQKLELMKLNEELMDISQIHQQIRTKLDATDKQYLATFYPEEIDIFINSCVKKLIMSRMAAPYSERNSQDVRTVKKNADVIIEDGVGDLPGDFWFPLRWSSDKFEFLVVDENHFVKKLSDPFEKRILLTYNGSRVWLSSKNTVVSDTISLVYLIKPPLADAQANATIPLPDHTHDEICDMVVMEMLQSLSRAKQN